MLRRDIVVRVNETVAVDITLSPSEIQEVVEVLGTPPALQTESGEIGDVVDHDTIVNLPLNGRNFIQLVELQPGAVSAQAPRRGNQLPQQHFRWQLLGAWGAG